MHFLITHPVYEIVYIISVDYGILVSTCIPCFGRLLFDCIYSIIQCAVFLLLGILYNQRDDHITSAIYTIKQLTSIKHEPCIQGNPFYIKNIFNTFIVLECKHTLLFASRILTMLELSLYRHLFILNSHQIFFSYLPSTFFKIQSIYLAYIRT